MKFKGYLGHYHKKGIATLFCVTLPLLLLNCTSIEKKNEMDDKENVSGHDDVPRVTGIGGIFFNSKNPKATTEWYSRNLGLVTDDFGSAFEFRNANNPDEVNYLRWSPFEIGTEYFAPSEKEFMVNYRVNNIEGLVQKLKENGVTIVDNIETYEYGKFVHIMDPDGNKIELWEPVDSFFTAIGGKTTK